MGTHWVTLYVNINNGNTSCHAIYFNIFRVEHIPKEIKKNRRKQQSIALLVVSIENFKNLKYHTSLKKH